MTRRGCRWEVVCEEGAGRKAAERDVSQGSARRHLVTRSGNLQRHLSDRKLRCVGGDGQAGQPAAQPAHFLCSPRARLLWPQEHPPRTASTSVHVDAHSGIQPVAQSFHQDIPEPTLPTSGRVKQPGRCLCFWLMLLETGLLVSKPGLFMVC